MTEKATNYRQERIFPVPKLPDEIKDAENGSLSWQRELKESRSKDNLKLES